MLYRSIAKKQVSIFLKEKTPEYKESLGISDWDGFQSYDDRFNGTI